jgi:hypothetical protein
MHDWGDADSYGKGVRRIGKKPIFREYFCFTS